MIIVQLYNYSMSKSDGGQLHSREVEGYFRLLLEELWYASPEFPCNEMLRMKV